MNEILLSISTVWCWAFLALFAHNNQAITAVQSSGCPFHRLMSSNSASHRRRATAVDETLESKSSERPTNSPIEWLLSSSISRWLSHRFNWDTKQQEDNISDITDDNRWPYSRLIQLESDWDENNQTWQTKIDRIWNEIITSPPISNRNPYLLEFIFRLALLGDDFTRLRLPLTFRPYDNSQKVLHSSGSFGRVRFRWTDQAFRSQHTGIFSEPTAEAIMSSSGGNRFVGNQSASFGYGFQFFRTNVSPGTILSLNSFFGGGAYWNVFGYMSCNHASLAEMSSLLPTIPGWTKFPHQNGLRHLATYNLNGDQAPRPIFPYSLCFVPNPELTKRVGTPPTLSSLSSLFSQFALVHPGERLFDIVAIFHPKFLNNPNLLLNPQYARIVGDVIALAPFTRSQFGDSRLFFQHQPFDDDLLLRPDWLPYMTLRNMVREGAVSACR